MNSKNTVALSAQKLNKYYGSKHALRDFSLDLMPGQIVGLMGENGCGKTTLMKIFAGAITNYKGSAQVFGQEIGTHTKARLSFLPDSSMFEDSMKIKSTISAYQDFFADFQIDKANEMLEAFELNQDLRINQMSKGMSEKLQLTLCLSRQADIYLLDEPISGVDPAARSKIIDGILQGYREEALMVISTHLISEIENIIDTSIFMKQGQIILSGQADELREEHGCSLDELFRKVY